MKASSTPMDARSIIEDSNLARGTSSARDTFVAKFQISETFMRHVLGYTLPPVLLLLSACNSEPEPAQQTSDELVADAEADQAEALETIASSEELTDAQSFLDNVVAINTLQMGLADIVKRDGEREDVRAFAEMIVADHRRLLTELKEAAAETSPDLVFNTSLSDDQQEALAEMRGARSADDMFLERVREGNREIAASIDEEIATGTYPALIDWANAAKTDVTAHAEALSAL